MRIRQVWAMYFSATGTTRRVVRRIAGEMGSALNLDFKERDFTPPQNRSEAPCFQEGDMVVFGVPVYAGRVPNLLLPYLKAVRGGGALAVPVVLYGNRNYDDALMELKELLEADGFWPVAGAAFVGEHSFSRRLAAGRPDQSDLLVADAFAMDVVRKVRAGTPDSLLRPLAVGGNVPIRPYFQPQDRSGNKINILKVKPRTGPECDGCGLCARICPMGSIPLADVRTVQGVCIKCCACVKGCPKGAKYFDDPGYLFHLHELEDVYGGTRRPPELFL